MDSHKVNHNFIITQSISPVSKKCLEINLQLYLQCASLRQLGAKPKP